MPDPHCSPGARLGGAFLLAQIGSHAAAKFAERLAPLKFTPPQAGILGVINRQKGISQQMLADLLGMFPSRLVLILDELEQAGLIGRRTSPTDRRIYALHLTARGKKALQAIVRVAREHEDALCAALDVSERAILTQLLSRIADEQQLRPGIHPGYRRLRGRP
ncbi:MAG TPA: MarR family transcriptional regulator [Chthoniobacterales bacterium]|nr:MarR family transcriptional regulator [Chthoniobacterales bacterium]